MPSLIIDIAFEFRRHRAMAEKAIHALTDDAFFRKPAEQLNSIALIVKHLAGNLRSRWADFAGVDGESPGRDRDSEFVRTQADSRENLMAAWDLGWQTLFTALERLGVADLERTVLIRDEPHRVQQALLRSVDHVAYHTGQILYLARWLNPEGEWLTIAPGQSREHRLPYLQS